MTQGFREATPLYLGLAGRPQGGATAVGFRRGLPFFLGLAGKPASVTGTVGFRSPHPFLRGLAGALGTAVVAVNTGARPTKKKEEEELAAILASAIQVIDHRRFAARRFSRTSSSLRAAFPR